MQVQLNSANRAALGRKLCDKIPMAELRSELNIPPLNQMAAKAILLCSWKSKYGAGNGLETILSAMPSEVNTRAKSRCDLEVPSPSLSKTLRYQASHLWNAAPLELRNTKSLYEAKRIIGQFVKQLPSLTNEVLSITQKITVIVVEVLVAMTFYYLV